MSSVWEKMKFFQKNLGPGLLWAGAAVGVSHLVQSTRAGASYGLILIWIVILANILKYPFFEFAPRYASSTGKSLLEGYKNLGIFYFYLYLAVTFGTMFTITAAVTVVTAGLAAKITGIILTPVLWSAILLIISIIILTIGKYHLLDRAIKVIIILLTVSTLTAVIFALLHGTNIQDNFTAPSLWDISGIAFMAALIGWMPSAVDISVWHSVWTIEKSKKAGEKQSLKNALLDFNIGYLGTALIAVFFLLLGTYIMYGSGETFANGGVGFSAQFLSLYIKSLGDWSYPVIALAAFTTMFSTTLTVLDAYPRVLRRAAVMVFPRISSKEDSSSILYWIWILITALGAVLLLSIFNKGMTMMVDLATTLSFVVAPVLAVMNYLVIKGKDVPIEAKLPVWLDILSWVGIVFLSLFSIAYLIWRFYY